jgi:hypothetical protein
VLRVRATEYSPHRAGVLTRIHPVAARRGPSPRPRATAPRVPRETWAPCYRDRRSRRGSPGPLCLPFSKTRIRRRRLSSCLRRCCARRGDKKGLATVDVPPVCILDPDGDIVRRLRQAGQSQPFESWPCYHTKLDTFMLAGQTVGIVGCVVGAPFAVLVAEELFASGCHMLLSVTSTGQIGPAVGQPPYFVIIERTAR